MYSRGRNSLLLGPVGSRRPPRCRSVIVPSNYPIIGAITPTAGGVVFFGDLGGNFYALDSSTGQKLFGEVLGGGGGIGGGIITYTVNGVQKVAVAAGFTMVAWPAKPVTAKVIVLGLDSASASQ
jgi:hypothetical protein